MSDILEFLHASPSKYDGADLTYLASVGPPERLREQIRKRWISIDFLDQTCGTPMHAAVANGRLDLVTVLLEEGSQAMNIQNKFGKTPFAKAAMGGHVAIVQKLYAAGATLENSYNPGPILSYLDGFNLLNTLNEKKHLEVLDFLLSLDPSEIRPWVYQVSEIGLPPLMNACIGETEISIVERFLQYGLDSLEVATSKGFTAVMLAARGNRRELVLLRAVGAIIPNSNEFLDEDAIALLHQPIPEAKVIAIRSRLYFQDSLTSKLLKILYPPARSTQCRPTIE